MKHIKILTAFFLIGIVAIIVTSCSKSDNNMSTGSNTVTIRGMAFTPATITVAAGTTVTWANMDGVAHTATSDDGTSFNSGTINPQNIFSITPNAAGTFPYHCNIHPEMHGTLIVTTGN